MSTFNSRPPVIGIAGTFASGKDKYAEHLKDTYGYHWETTSDLVRKEALASRGSTERPVLQEVATELRFKLGPTIFIKEALKHPAPLVVTGIRAPGEVKALRDKGGILVFIDAPIEVRYKRMIKRSRDLEVELTLEEFTDSEQKEWYGGPDDADFNLRDIKKSADIVIDEDLGFDEFFRVLDNRLGLAGH